MWCMKAIGYIRVSTDQQAERGISLAAQRERVRAMATVQGAELLDVIVDGGECAKSMNRPGLQQVLSLVNAGTARGIRETRRGANLSGGTSGHRFRHQASGNYHHGCAEPVEREAIGERTREALRHKR